MFKDWRIDPWYVSGVHTGWRIVRGTGWNAEYDSGYAYDWHKSGDYEAKRAEAEARLKELMQ